MVRWTTKSQPKWFSVYIERLHSSCHLQHTDLCRHSWSTRLLDSCQSWFWCHRVFPRWHRQHCVPASKKQTEVQKQKHQNKTKKSHGFQLQSIPSFFMVRQRSLIITEVRFWKGYLRQMAFHLPSPYFCTPSLIHSLSCTVHFCKEKEPAAGRSCMAHRLLPDPSWHIPSPITQEQQGRQTGPGSCTQHSSTAGVVQQPPSYGSGRELLVAARWDLFLGNSCQICVPHLSKTLSLSSMRGIWQTLP